MISRREFEEWWARDRAVTVEELGRRGWVSALLGGEWQAVCVPPESTPGERARILDGLMAVATFGDTPPTQEGGGA